MSRPPDPNRVIARLLGPGALELTCEECFEQLDAYVELELAGLRGEGRVAGMRAHLQGCPACREDHDSLLAYISEISSG